MKQFKLLTLVLAILLTIGFSGNAVAGGIEPGDGSLCACSEIMANGEPEGLEKKGPYLRGTFTISSFLDACGDENYIIHLYLKKGRNYYLTSIEMPVGNIPLCQATQTDLIDAIAASGSLCNESPYIWDAFNVTGVPVVKRLIITREGHCESSSPIIKGYITVSMVPENAFPGCPPPPPE